MILNDILEVIVVTYNRKPFLENTLSKIFADNSPIKDLKITILDNASDDGTSELIDEYCKNHSNLKHSRHKKNIGGNANIARAFEIAEKKYVWILCDDDEYIWENWQFIEKGIEKDYDIVLTKINDVEKSQMISLILRQLSFLPSGIYKTEIITSEALQNAIFCIPYLFPHIAIVCSAINNNKSFFIPERPVVYTENNTTDYTRGNNAAHPRQCEIFWFVGLINTLQLIQDKKLRTNIINNLSLKKGGFFAEAAARFKYNRMYYHNSIRNISDILCNINFWQKCQFIVVLIWLDIIYFIKKFILRDKRYK